MKQFFTVCNSNNFAQYGVVKTVILDNFRAISGDFEGWSQCLQF